MTDRVKAFSKIMGRGVLLLLSVILACLSPCLSYGVEEDSGGATAIVANGGKDSGGSDTVQPDLFRGSMSYQIPIEVPPGRNGMDPKLALNYSSSSGNGWVGVGWELEVGAIERSTRHGVDYTKGDYLLRRSGSTSELVAVTPLEYRAKIESDFTKISQVKVTDSSISRYFVATNKTGIKYYYGQTENACVYSSNGVFKWALSRIEDPNGNFITFTYFKDNGQIYLDHIDYNGNQIKFYLDDRDDKPNMFASNFSIKTTKRLKTIDVLANGARIRKYELGYDTDPNKPGDQYSVKTGRSLLSTVTQFNKDGETLPAIKLSYSADNNFLTRDWSTNPYKAADKLSDKNEAIITADFEGDGKMDVAHARNGSTGWQVSRSTGSEFETWEWSTSPYLAVDRLSELIHYIKNIYSWVCPLGAPACTYVYVPTQVIEQRMNERVITGDFDGDGNTDVARTRSGNAFWQVSLSTGKADTGFVNKTSEWQVGQQFLAADKLYDHNEEIITGDFNGDGKTDVAHARSESGGWQVSLSTGLGFVTDTWLTNGKAIDKLNDNNEQVIVGDFNGDGKTDIAHSRSEWGGWRVSLSTGSGFVTGTELWSTDGWAIDKLSDNNEQVIVGDFNGDGKTDIAHSRSEWGGWRVSLSTGSGFVTGTELWSTDGWAIDKLSDGNEQVITGDFNGDGLTDIAHSRSGWGGWRVSLSTGSGFVTETELWSTDGWAIDKLSDGNERVITGDFNGDGLTEVAHSRSEWGSWKVSGNTVLTSPVPDMLVKIDNGSGGEWNINYTPSTQLDANKLPFPIQAVSSISSNDGNGNISTTFFNYSNGYYHIGERDFRGFNHVTVTGPAGPSGGKKVTETWFHQGNETAILPEDISMDALKTLANVSTGYLKGKPYRVRISDSSGKTFSETETTYTADRDGAAPWFTPPYHVDTYICDGSVIGACKGTVNNRLLQTNYTYDSDYPNIPEYGNLSYEYRYGDVSDYNDKSTVYRTYSPNEAAWIVGLPASETIYQGIGTTTPIASTSYYYDGGVMNCNSQSQSQMPDKGRLTRVVRSLKYAGTPDTSVEERIAYDSYGNSVCRRDAKGNTTTIAYDSSNTFPVSVTSPPTTLIPSGITTTTTYYGVDNVPTDTGLYGQVKSVTDPNGAATTKEYDTFGRQSKEKRADETWTSWAYNNFGEVGGQHVRTLTSDNLWTESYFDGLGRTYLSKTKGPESKTIATNTTYDARGAVSKSTLPFLYALETPRYTLTDYDAIGRVTKTGQDSPADYIRSLVCYNKDETIKVDPNNHRRREVRDAYGRLTKVQEYKGTTVSCNSGGNTSLYANHIRIRCAWQHHFGHRHQG